MSLIARTLSRLGLTVVLALAAMPALAQELDYAALGQLPILEDGRVKPLDTFARNLRTKLAGQAQVQGITATHWLAATLFDPADASQMPTFKVGNAHLRAALNLPERADKTYALSELAMGMAATADQAAEIIKKDPKTLSRDENDLIKLHEHVLAYNQLLQGLSLVLPLPAPAPSSLALSDPTYLQAQRFEPELLAQVRAFLTPELIDNPERLTADQQQQAAFLAALQQLRQGGEHNQMLRVIPLNWQQSADWLAPWQVVISGKSSPITQDLITKWQAAASAYRAKDAAAWRSALSALHTATLAAQNDATLPARLQLEVLFNQLHLFDVAALTFVLAALLCLPGLRQGLRQRLPARCSWLVLALGSMALTAALTCRVLILQRPPVGTLYESMLFVGLIVAFTALMATRRTQLPALIAGGALLPTALLLLAPFVQQDGETLTMLSAVLNTNFWLTIHVLCITAGYGACLATAVLAYYMLATHGTRHDQSARLPLLHKLSLVALLLTAVGTLLGGVWADQSWGRFWGWDPKENGALIIVLWLIWIHHSRLAGQIKPLTFIAGMAALAIVVAQAWFGVNLLSTGLHSYGFIEGIAAALFGFTALNLLAIAILWVLARKRNAPQVRHA